MSPMRFAILICSSSVSWFAGLLTFGEGWYIGTRDLSIGLCLSCTIYYLIKIKIEKKFIVIAI